MNVERQGFNNLPVKNDPTIYNTKRLIWLYFWLLIFEGSLRKWLVPQLSAPLLIIRDPVVIGAYFLALKGGIFPKDVFTKSIIYLAFFSFLGGLAAIIISGSGNLSVTLFGLRANFLHLPLLFLIPKVFNLDDVQKLGRWVLLLAAPMAILMVYQFGSPSDAFINRTVGTGEGFQLSSALGKIRPPGTFSFITGPILYFTFVASFLLYGLLEQHTYKMWLLSTAGLGLALALAVSGSRGAITSVGIVVLSLIIILFIRPDLISKSYKLLILAAIVGIGISFIPSFKEGLDVLNTRTESANAVEAKSGGIVGRFIGGFLEPFNNTDQIPLLGYGLGMGTNAGSAILTGTGKAKFLLAEGEWARVFLESGLVLGLLFILLRIALISWMGSLSIKSAADGNILPLLLFSACALIILNGQFGQPTTVGFAILGGGLCLTSCQKKSYKQALSGSR